MPNPSEIMTTTTMMTVYRFQMSASRSPTLKLLCFSSVPALTYPFYILCN